MAGYSLPDRIGDLSGLLKRYDAAVARRDQFRTLLQECYDYVLPDRELFRSHSPGEKRGKEIYDSTATLAVNEFASRMQASICPPWRQWSKFVPGPGLPKDQRDSDELLQYLDEQTDLFFSYINHSNFAIRSHEAFLDLSVGTGALTLELDEQGKGFSFESIPPAQLAIEEGPSGIIETTFTDRKCQVSHLPRLYPGVSLPDAWEKALKDNPIMEVSYVNAVVYEPISREYFLIALAKAPQHVMYVRALGDTSPVIVFRWSVIPGETWGRGPVMSALQDIRTLNKVVEFNLTAAAMNLAPPLTGVSDGVLNPYTVQIMPNTIIPVMSNDQANPSLRPLMTEIRPDLAQFILADLRQQVRFSLFADPRRREGPVQSATEVMIEDRDFVQRIGSAFGRLQTEFLERVINRGVALLRGIGKMAPFKVDGREVTLKHLSPLARAQDNEELMALRTALEMTIPFGPQAVQMSFRTESVGEYIGKRAGVDSSLLRTDAERKQVMQQVAQAAAMQQGMPTA